jgi:hypothetical protein
LVDDGRLEAWDGEPHGSAAGGVAADVFEQAVAGRVQDLRDNGWRKNRSSEWGA